MGRPGKKPGSPKTGGRKKGTPNKINSEISERIRASGIDPLNVMLDLLHESDPQLRFSAAKELIQYVYPKRKAIEIVESPDNSDLEGLDETPSETLLRFVKGDRGGP